MKDKLRRLWSRWRDGHVTKKLQHDECNDRVLAKSYKELRSVSQANQQPCLNRSVDYIIIS